MRKNFTNNLNLSVWFIGACCLIISLSVKAQESNSGDQIIAVQAGTVTMQHGKALIALSKEALSELSTSSNSLSYYVTITSVDNNFQFGIADKNSKSFTIKVISPVVEGSDGVSVDYVVFAKSNKQMMMFKPELLSTMPVKLQK
jgi:hypothetical protein